MAYTQPVTECFLQWVQSQQFSSAHAFFVRSWSYSHLRQGFCLIKCFLWSLLKSSRGEAGNQHSFIRLTMISTTFSFASILVGDHAMKTFLCFVQKPSLCRTIYSSTARPPKIGPLPCMTTCPSRLTSLWRDGPFLPKCCTSTLLDFHQAFYYLQTNGRVYFPVPVVNLAWSCAAASGSRVPMPALHQALHLSLNLGK